MTHSNDLLPTLCSAAGVALPGDDQFDGIDLLPLLTGQTESPGLFETMELLGKPRAMGRLGDAMRVLGEPGKKKMKKWEKRRAEQKKLAAAQAEAKCHKCASDKDLVEVEVEGKRQFFCAECRPK